MRIRWIRIVIVVFRPAVRKKERLLPVTEAMFQRLLKLFTERAIRVYSFQRKQNVRCVEAVDPRLVWFSPVAPRAVRLLLVDDVSSGALCFMTQRSVVG